jgi:hypothetical protein
MLPRRVQFLKPIPWVPASTGAGAPGWETQDPPGHAHLPVGVADNVCGGLPVCTSRNQGADGAPAAAILGMLGKPRSAGLPRGPQRPGNHDPTGPVLY